MGYINVKLLYPEGKNLNITRKKLRVEVTYKSDKPQSFTTKIEFLDENQRCYSIPISGTTDNCLFTNYGYMQRAINEYKILGEFGAPILIVNFIYKLNINNHKF
jgi:hypothetical protein